MRFSHLLCFNSSLIDTGKLSTDSLKKIYSSNSILKLSSPSSTHNMKLQSVDTQSRDIMFKSFQNEVSRPQMDSTATPNLTVTLSTEAVHSKAPLSSLYQRAQKDVLNTKYSKIHSSHDQTSEPKAVSNSMTSLKLKLSSSITPTYLSNKREQTPQNQPKVLVPSSHNTNLNTRYASPSQTFEKFSAGNGKKLTLNQSKENESKLYDFVSPASKSLVGGNEFNLSYDCFRVNETNKSKITHKLDLSNYSQVNQSHK